MAKYMTKSSFPSDTVTLKEIDTGGQYAGNGGSGCNKGDISNEPSITVKPSNQAEGADVHVKTGDEVSQKAYWDAGGANAKADEYSKAYGGKAYSNGDQRNYGGDDTSKVYAETTAHQSTFLAADTHQSVWAGLAGYGGSGNEAAGGDVEVYV